jgi:RimJ/RimL family protein N-acetyltransferase/nitroimidazol reductase NimA-like FMN-containing flavoprotein (pyridoxamine 5'-phosphate oxidase superfamily)
MSDVAVTDSSYSASYSPSAYPASARTTPSRYPERATYERSAAHEVLDGAYVCHVGFVVDGAPHVLPTLFVRVGETIYLHGSRAATPWLAARRDGGLPIVVEVTKIDALVLARSQFHHSANYRSVVAHGIGRLVTDESTKRAAMTALVDKVGAVLAGSWLGGSGLAGSGLAGASAPSVAASNAGSVAAAIAGSVAGSVAAAVPDGLRRSTHTRPPTTAELAKTAVVALDLHDVSVKRRTGGVGDDEADLTLPYWAGIVPLRSAVGMAEPDDGVTVAAPAYVSVRSPWLEAARLCGRYVTLEPLRVEHAAALFAGLDDDEVWQHSTAARPTNPDDMATWIASAISDPHRVPWLQRDAASSEVIGTTSYHDVNESAETLGIGWSMVARPRWRTAINTESKLLLLTHAFETLHAGRVEFHVDVQNERSQAAVARLGATREGVLRRHKRRGDGTWRDSVIFAVTVDEWPSVRNHIAAKLAAHETVVHAGRD